MRLASETSVNVGAIENFGKTMKKPCKRKVIDGKE